MRALKEFFVMLFAFVVFTILSVFGFLYTLFKHIIKRNYSANKQLAPIFRGNSLASDGKANCSAGELLTDLFVKEGGIKYGKWFNTISRITGENFLNGTLTEKGIKFKNFLDFCLGKDHCVNAYKNK